MSSAPVFAATLLMILLSFALSHTSSKSQQISSIVMFVITSTLFLVGITLFALNQLSLLSTLPWADTSLLVALAALCLPALTSLLIVHLRTEPEASTMIIEKLNQTLKSQGEQFQQLQEELQSKDENTTLTENKKIIETQKDNLKQQLEVREQQANGFKKQIKSLTTELIDTKNKNFQFEMQTVSMRTQTTHDELNKLKCAMPKPLKNLDPPQYPLKSLTLGKHQTHKLDLNAVPLYS